MENPEILEDEHFVWIQDSDENEKLSIFQEYTENYLEYQKTFRRMDLARYSSPLPMAHLTAVKTRFHIMQYTKNSDQVC